MAVKKKNPTFQRMIGGITGGKKLEPLIFNALNDPQHKGFNMKVRSGKGSNRPPDGWFHPSTHPLWTERQLYYYLAEPEAMVKEPFDYLGTLATTGGTFWHEFMQHILIDAGVLKDTEVYVEDPECGSRGAMDGHLVFDEAWEFKTMYGLKMKKFTELGPPDSPELLAVFKDKCPEYWAQAQEYLRMSGFRTMRFTIMEIGFPFTMAEIAVPYTPQDALPIRDKYMRVRQAVADQVLPQPCCIPGSQMARTCVARDVCPIGRLA